MTPSEDRKIREKFQQKTWNEIKTNNSWAIFKIIAEFVEGYDRMARTGPCVTIFGSARTKPDHKYYKLAEEVAQKIVDHGYGVITGGGPGIMEAGNMGAKKGRGKSVGLNIDLPFEQSANIFIDPDKLISFEHFFVRKVMFVKYAQGFIVLPGGFGTFDELFEAITLIQTEKIGKFPIILVGSSYWQGLMDWVKDVVLKEENNIAAQTLSKFNVSYTDIKEEIMMMNLIEEDNQPRAEFPNSDNEDDDDGKGFMGGSGGAGAQKGGDVKSKTPVLDNFGRDLTKYAEEGKLDPIVGREKEIERVSQILSRRKKNSFMEVYLKIK